MLPDMFIPYRKRAIPAFFPGPGSTASNELNSARAPSGLRHMTESILLLGVTFVLGRKPRKEGVRWLHKSQTLL